MTQTINTNVASLNAQRNLNQSGDSLRTSLERLSTGLRINSAKDDAAGLAISERFTAQIRGIDQAVRNANDGISFAQTAEGALGTVGDSLQRIRELAVQSANDTNSTSDRQALNDEVQQLIAEINRVSNSTQFNGQNILDGTSSELTFQVGANRGQTITVSGVDARASQLGAEVLTGFSVEDDGLSQSDGDHTFEEGDLSDISVNGVAIDLSAAGTLDEVVDAINARRAETGVDAARGNEASTLAGEPLRFRNLSGTFTGEVILNGVTIAVDDSLSTDDLIERLNAISDQTGVEAVSVADPDVATDAIVLSSSADFNLEIVELTGEFALEGDPVADFGVATDGTPSELSNTYRRGIVLSTEIGSQITVGGTDAQAIGLAAFEGEVAVAETKTLAGVSVATRADTTNALETIDLALDQINRRRAELGAVQTRFESTISNLSIGSENLSAARSRIRDADFAQETSNLAKAQILQQAGTSVLTQANSLPQNVLALLQ